MHYPFHTQATSHPPATIQTRLVVIVLCAAWLGLALNACAKPRTDLPPETPRLSETKRKEYDVLFFNEFASRQHSRGKERDDCKRREKLFRQMAQEGYEVANIALHLYDIGRCKDYRDVNEQAVRRLEELAERGDTAAMCFTVPGLTMIAKSGVSQKYAQYIRMGAERGHPHCMYTLSLWYQSGSYGGVSIDMDTSFHWMLAAARKGNANAQSSLAYQYRVGKNNSGKGEFPKDPAKALCWARAAANSSPAMEKNNLISLESTLGLSGKRNLIDAQNERERQTGKPCDL